MDDLKSNQNDQDIKENGQAVTREELDICRSELTLTKERYLYLQAEFDNYKKRLEKERLSWIDMAQDTILIDVLGIVDDMERALQEVESIPGELRAHIAGFEMIAKSISKFLKKYDVQRNPLYKDIQSRVL